VCRCKEINNIREILYWFQGSCIKTSVEILLSSLVCPSGGTLHLSWSTYGKNALGYTQVLELHKINVCIAVLYHIFERIYCVEEMQHAEDGIESILLKC